MIGRKSFLIVLVRGVSALLGFVGLYLITRYFSEDTYGAIAWTMSILAIFNSLADLGFSTAHIKRVSEGKDLGDCLATFATIKLVLTACMVVVVIAGFALWTMVLDRPLTDTSFELLLLFMLYYIFYDVAVIATTTFDARTQTAKTQLSVLMDVVVRVPLIFFLAVPSPGVMQLAFCYVMGGMAVAVVAIAFLFRDHIKLKKPTLFRSYYSFALPIALASVAGVAISNIDRVLLGFFWGTTQVAVYAAAQSIVSMIAVVGAAVVTLLYPTLSRMNEEGDRDSLRLMVEKAERYISFVLTPVICVILVFPEQVATILLSGKYVGAGQPMQLLALGMLIAALGGVYSTHIVAVNRVREIVWLSFLQLGILIVLLLILVPNVVRGLEMLGLGAQGAALASLVTTIIIVILYRYIVWRMVGAGANPSMLKHLLAGVLTVLVLFFIGAYYQPTRWYDLVITWALSAGTFYLITYALRELEKRDIRYFLEVINPKEMLIYLRQELGPKR